MFTRISCVKTKRELVYRKGTSRPTPFTVVLVIPNTQALIESSMTAFCRDVLVVCVRNGMFVVFVLKCQVFEAYRLSPRSVYIKTRSMKSKVN